MGILIESKTVNREKRYIGLNIVKNRMGVNSGSITVATGYYETFTEGGPREWVTEKEEVVTLSNDQLTALFIIKPSQVGLAASTTNLFSMLDKSIYAVLEGLIPINYVLDITVKDKTSNNILNDYSVVISKIENNAHIFSAYALEAEPVVIRGEIAIGARVTINKYGYQTFTKDYPMLSGSVPLEVSLEKLAEPEPPVTPEPTEPEPTPPLPEE